MTTDRAQLITLLEELTLNAWPPIRRIALDGWQIGVSGGITSRTDSVIPLQDNGNYALTEKLASAEDVYRHADQPASVKLTPVSAPSGLHEAVMAKAATRSGPTHVQTATADTVLREPVSMPAGYEVEFLLSYSDAWYAVWIETSGRNAYAQELRGVLSLILPNTCYATIRQDGVVVGVGLGVRERSWVGLYCIGVLPSHRRRGLGLAVSQALVRWASDNGAAHAYLQVEGTNTAATSLYARLGFTTIYDYWYYSWPAPPLEAH